MSIFFALCAALGAFFLLPILPNLFFLFLMLYGLVKLLETTVTPEPPKDKERDNANPPSN